MSTGLLQPNTQRYEAETLHFWETGSSEYLRMISGLNNQ